MAAQHFVRGQDDDEDEPVHLITERLCELGESLKFTVFFLSTGEARLLFRPWISETLEFQPNKHEQSVLTTFTIEFSGWSPLQYVGVPPFRVPFYCYLRAALYTEITIQSEPQFKGTAMVHGRDTSYDGVIPPCFCEIVPGVPLLYNCGMVGDPSCSKIHVYKIN